MKIIFFGSDDFAALHLEHLLASGQEVLCCVTGPDKPQGRGMKLAVGPIKQAALEHKITCLQPVTLKNSDTVKALRSYGADIFVVVAYGRLLTQEILDIPKMLCMNVHGSLLPKYRGAAPVNWAILNGDNETGVTIQKMVLALDAGDIIAREVMGIHADENAAQLRQRMAQAGARLLTKILGQYPSGNFPLIPQDKAQVSWAPKLTKEMGLINWNSQALSIFNQVRGLKPWPGAHTFINSKMLKITQAEISNGPKGDFTPGQVVNAGNSGIDVACSDNVLRVKEVQPEAGKVMPAGSFVAGYKVMTGTTFMV